MRAAAVRRDIAQSPTGRLQEESPGKGRTPPSATAKTTETETTTDQTAGTETDRTGEGQGQNKNGLTSAYKIKHVKTIEFKG